MFVFTPKKEMKKGSSNCDCKKVHPTDLKASLYTCL